MTLRKTCESEILNCSVNYSFGKDLMLKKKTRTTYFYKIKEIPFDLFKQKHIHSFYDAYHKIFLTKAAHLTDTLDQKIIDICDCRISTLNRKITGHVLNARSYMLRTGNRFDLNCFFDVFSITWNVKIEPVDISYLEQTLGSDHELAMCKNLYKLCWHHPVFEEKRDPENKPYWIKTQWTTFEVFFDMDELQNRMSPEAKFKNEAKLTVSKDRVSIHLGFSF